ncbi:MAG: aldehyde dehydrogenase [Candidatus Aenigmarchaeota archaeon]|nr:aldehyde dehydrogenase [Candidatus Aenigmarchaeota archaeon]
MAGTSALPIRQSGAPSYKNIRPFNVDNVIGGESRQANKGDALPLYTIFREFAGTVPNSEESDLMEAFSYARDYAKKIPYARRVDDGIEAVRKASKELLSKREDRERIAALTGSQTLKSIEGTLDLFKGWADGIGNLYSQIIDDEGKLLYKSGINAGILPGNVSISGTWTQSLSALVGPMVTRPDRRGSFVASSYAQLLADNGYPGVQAVNWSSELHPNLIQTLISEGLREGKVHFFGSNDTINEILPTELKDHPNLIAYGSGHGMAIVDETADLEQAAKFCVQGRIFNTGNMCTCTNNVIAVGDTTYDKLLNYFEGCKETLMPGDPRKPDSDLGWIGSHDLQTIVKPLLLEHTVAPDEVIVNYDYMKFTPIETNPHSKFARKEWPYPILGIMGADNMDKAIDMVGACLEPGCKSICVGLHMDPDKPDLLTKYITALKPYAHKVATNNSTTNMDLNCHQGLTIRNMMRPI